MSSVIEKLRNRSDSTKNKLALIFAAAVTIIIVLFWFLGIKNKNGDTVAKENSASEELKPLFMIFQNAKNGFKNIKEESKNYKASTIESSQ